MTFIALAFVLIGSFLILYSVFIYLQKGVEKQNQANNIAIFGNDAKNNGYNQTKKQKYEQKEQDFRDFYDARDSSNDMAKQAPNPIHQATSHQNDTQDTANKKKWDESSQQPPDTKSGTIFQEPSTRSGSGEIHIRNSQENGADNSPDPVHDTGSPNIVPDNTAQASTSHWSPDSNKNVFFQGNSLYYVDQSGQIQYDGSDLEVDETLTQYKKFFRVGDGKISLSAQGITFQGEEILQHFAFEEIQKVIFYQNCAVVLPREGKEANIFFPQKYSLFRTSFKELMDTLKAG